MDALGFNYNKRNITIFVQQYIYGRMCYFFSFVCACVEDMILMGTRTISVVVGERKNKYPGVCSHGYYHDVGGVGLLSPSCASLLHSLKVALANESLHDMPLPQTYYNPYSTDRHVMSSQIFPLYKHIKGSELFRQGSDVLIAPDASQKFS